MIKNKKGFTLPNFSKKNLRGFTLIELLIVVAIITILAAAIVVGINPARHFTNARNAARWSQMNVIATAIYSYAVEHGGAFPVAPTGGNDCIGDAGTPVTIGTNPAAWCTDASTPPVSLLVPDYLRTLPEPPLADATPAEVYQIQFVDAAEQAIKITSTADEAIAAGVELIQ